MVDHTPIRRLMIANRGEIVARIAATAHRLGIETAGVFSDPDELGVAATAVDMAYRLEGESPAQTYLMADKVIAAARQLGCDAVHPGYGFLAESAEFAEAVIDAGMTWVGPTPANIRLLGDKMSAKAAAVEAGVPTTTVIHVNGGETPEGVTFPALVKAAAGGGGRGMRIVHEAEDLADAIAGASREADAAFGDGRVFIEPYIANGRHVEVQIAADRAGSVVHLGERECSIQRRNQKVLEESPSPGISDTVRSQLCEAAVALAVHVGYENLGTVEFLVGDDDTITFLEVNTRLQVEHPVTEAVTGLDLVELQLRLAMGEAIGFDQAAVTFAGHAIEARIVAEDPSAGWIPSVGVVERFDVAGEVRVDAGVAEGGLVSPHYDSLIAKVIAHAPTRDQAAAVLKRSLRRSLIAGVETNLDCTVAILNEADFLAGDTTTKYLDDHAEVQARPETNDERLSLLIAAAMVTEHNENLNNSATGFAPIGWRNLPTSGVRDHWTVGPDEIGIELSRSDGVTVAVGPFPAITEDGSLEADDRVHHQVRVLRIADGELAAEISGVRRSFSFVCRGDTVMVQSAGGSLDATRLPRFSEPEVEFSGAGPISPLPGTVIAVHVADGDTVAEGQTLVVVEAMKMEHQITAPADAVVARVCFGVGDRVDSGDLLVELEASADGSSA